MNYFLAARVHYEKFVLIIACGLLLAACSRIESETSRASSASPSHTLNESATDESLQRAATNALGTRDGTIIVLDAQTGRIRAITNERTAYEETLPPGSTVKPFAMLAALEGGIVTSQTRLACAARFRRAQVDLGCSHLRPLPALSPADALAHSCNYFHARLGESLSTAALARTLTRFGFDRRTDAANTREATGAIPHDAAPASLATGESNSMTTTPIRLITAYLALANGGQLLTPHRAEPPSNVHHSERSPVRIADSHRRLLLAGMRGAVTHGTAAPAELHAIPNTYIFGKTGTATEHNNTRPHGWFVGFDADKEFETDIAPERLRLVVLALVRDAHGVDAAQITRPVFAAFAQTQRTREAMTTSDETSDANETTNTSDTTNELHDEQHDDATINTLRPAANDRSIIRVRLVRQARTFTLPLDEYLFGVLAAEASTESEPEALKAQAVTSRTYALHNLRRHQRQGYDLCDLTHCQRFVPVPDRDARPEFYHLVREAISQTENEILHDEQARTADAYFSASCGGHTANIADLWNAPRAPPHLRGKVDAYCAHTAQEEWTDEIPTARLLPALRTDPRSDVGAHLSDIRITRRDRSGRAATITLIGERTRTVSGWTLKTIIGRTLGWSTLKSTRFRITRTASGFRFQGRGFGHGLGLCQAGAHEMARRTSGYREILGYYFPGTHIRRSDRSAVAGGSQHHIRTCPLPPSGLTGHMRHSLLMRLPTSGISANTGFLDFITPLARFTYLFFIQPHRFIRQSTPRRTSDTTRRTLSATGLRVNYPAAIPRREIEVVISTFERARADLAARLDAARLPDVTRAPLDIFIHHTTADFTRTTGQPAWVAAATSGNRINLQPLAVLRRRNVLTTTIRHELTHLIIERIARRRPPRWLAEGLAAHVADEGRQLTRDTRPLDITLDELERRLAASQTSADDTRALYAEAYRRTSRIIRDTGEANVWRRVKEE